MTISRLAHYRSTSSLDDEVVAELTPGQLLIKRIKEHKGLIIGFLIIVVLMLIGVFAPLIAPYDPFEQILSKRLIPPCWSEGGSLAHLFGTDHLGRDYLSRLIFGTRISLMIGYGAATVGMLIGVSLGVCAGYFGGRVDQLISYILTCQLSLPGLLLAMTLVFYIGPSVYVVIGVIGVLHWTYYLVVTRAAAMQIREMDYIAAAQAMGSSKFNIIWREILPNLMSQIIVIFTLEVGFAILAESALSFLGIGIQAPTPSWGLMIAEGKVAMFFQPWLVIVPGVALFVLVLATNLMGDGIRDVTSPENRN
ncbi:MAG: ABC transporter permease [Desulfobulbaceae bacterium]|nr:ABC transporter permease [Desulfobulbaceae bacterium]